MRHTDYYVICDEIVKITSNNQNNDGKIATV
jgi:hypothetical protein